jgi:hypothetical protein
MKNKLASIGKSLGNVVALIILATTGLYLYLCRTTDVPTNVRYQKLAQDIIKKTRSMSRQLFLWAGKI